MHSCSIRIHKQLRLLCHNERSGALRHLPRKETRQLESFLMYIKARVEYYQKDQMAKSVARMQ